MQILVIGSGGREHALVWKISRSPEVLKVYCAPGNGGISQDAELVDIKAEDTKGLLDFAKKERIDLTVVGPEAPLAGGIVDEFNKCGLLIFGPTKELARLEASKVFAKQILKKFNIPTADFEIFDDATRAKDYIRKQKAPIVVKADGLCGGKGVIVAKTIEEAEAAIQMIMEDRVFGSSGDRVVIEECLMGEEASIMVICDGKNFIPLLPSQDHKRIFDEDTGPNTGGMGAYSPAPLVNNKLYDEIINRIIRPLIDGLTKDGVPYKGLLYAGIMVTGKGPKVLEFNVRFGDPESQAVLPLLRTDLVELLLGSIEGKLKRLKPIWHQKACISIVCASGGYPGNYNTGYKIGGLDKAGRLEDVTVFHAGTKRQNGDFVTSGGRVLNVTALGKDIPHAIKNAYNAVRLITFEGMHYRRDIGKKALKYALNV